MLSLAGKHLATLALGQRHPDAHRHTVPHAHATRQFPAPDTLLHDALIVNLCSVAALTWLVYDMILCFPDELRLVWGRWYEHKGRHTRRIYVIVRYASVLNLGWFVAVNASFNLSLNVLVRVFHFTDFLGLLTPIGRSCDAWPYIVVITTSVATLLPDVMLLIRINAVYGWRVPYILSTAFLFFLQLITSLGIGFVYVSTTAPLPSTGLPIPGCLTTAAALPATFTLAAWIPSVIAQCIYLALVLMPYLSVTCSLDANGRLSWAALRTVRSLIPTMNVFAAHGIIYVTIAIGAKIATAALVLSQSGPLQAVGIPWLVAIYPILASRLYLAMVAHLHFPVTTPILPTPSGPPCSVGSVRLSYASALASPPLASGPITFATRASLSHGSLSRLDFDDEF